MSTLIALERNGRNYRAQLVEPTGPVWRQVEEEEFYQLAQQNGDRRAAAEVKPNYVLQRYEVSK